MSFVARVYRRLGLLVCLSLAAFVVAAVLQHVSRLPGSYTWFEPVLALRYVLGSSGVPVAIVLVYALGAFTRRGEWDVEGAARLLGRPLDLGACLRAAVGPAVCATALILIDALLLRTDREWFDWLALVVLGVVFSGHRPDPKQLAKEVGFAALGSAIFISICYCYTVSKALTFVSGRQFDAAIIGLESTLFGCVPHRVLAKWAASHPSARELFDWVYFHLLEHMTLTTVLLVAVKKRTLRTEYLAALALCYLIGGASYHAFPALGPSYFEPHYFEFLDQGGLLTSGIRRALKSNTDGVLHHTAHRLRTWGYVAAMPSLHVAQELVMLYYARASLPAFLLSIAFTTLTVLSVLALGWHYALDALGGVAVAGVAIAVARWQRYTLMPRCLSPAEDAATVAPKPVLARFLAVYLVARQRR